MSKSATEKRFLKEFGGNVRRERVVRQITQEGLAELTGLHPRTIQKTEAGELNLLVTTLAKLQSALRCDWSALLGPGVRGGAPTPAPAPRMGKAVRKRG